MSTHKKNYTQLFTAALFITAKVWKQSRYPSSVDEWINKCGLCIKWNIIQP